MSVKENLAENLINFRKSMKLTQAEFAEKFNYSDKAISKWERGESAPDIEVLKQIADFYDITIDTLISKPKVKKPSVLKNLSKKRFVFSCIATGIVWLIAVCCFCFLSIIIPSITQPWLAFVYAFPVTLVILLILTSVWGKNLFNAIFSSLLLWSVIGSVFISFVALSVYIKQLWLIFLIGIPLQILLLLIFFYKNFNKKKEI